MKNLPDKIYLNLGDLSEEEYNELDFHDLSEVTWSEDDVQGRNVGYVLKDAFIEKACEYFAPHISDNSGGYDREWIIEDFKKYIKGE